MCPLSPAAAGTIHGRVLQPAAASATLLGPPQPVPSIERVLACSECSHTPSPGTTPVLGWWSWAVQLATVSRPLSRNSPWGHGSGGVRSALPPCPWPVLHPTPSARTRPKGSLPDLLTEHQKHACAGGDLARCGAQQLPLRLLSLPVVPSPVVPLPVVPSPVPFGHLEETGLEHSSHTSRSQERQRP